jgi:hypothetical protein
MIKIRTGLQERLTKIRLCDIEQSGHLIARFTGTRNTAR